MNKLISCITNTTLTYKYNYSLSSRTVVLQGSGVLRCFIDNSSVMYNQTPSLLSDFSSHNIQQLVVHCSLLETVVSVLFARLSHLAFPSLQIKRGNSSLKSLFLKMYIRGFKNEVKNRE